MKIRFIGAAQEVTGSKHLITTESGKNILLDCGMFQGKGMDTDQKNRDLSFDARKIDYVILSHAHIDHSGLIPYLYKKGFRGSVICTAATRDLCSIMLEDSAHIQELDVKWYNKKQAKRHQPPIKPLYTQTHARKCMELFIAVAYNRRFYINDEISVKFTDSGHMLGSAVANLRIKENGRTVNIAYTGDIGRHKNRLLRAPEAFPQCDYLICESTYGDRLHPDDTDAEKNLYDIVADTCIRRHGKLIIPSFSIGRTQEIVYVLNKYYNTGQLPESLKVYVDSPLAVNATEIFRLHLDQMNKDVQRVLRTDSNPFGFNSLKYIENVAESKALNTDPFPSIIISASGMLEAGRVKHHVANHISDPSTTVMIVGYCTPSSLGARIQRPGLRQISIFGDMYDIRARITKLEGFSGHGDYQEMIDFLSCQDKGSIKKVFLVHGEKQYQDQYRQHMEEAGFHDVEIPEPQSVYEL